MFGSASAAAFASLGLIWLILAGPGFFGHGASLLWAGAPREGMRAGFYDIIITPGNRSVRKKSDQMVGAQLVGFDARSATLFAKFAGTSKWEPAPMMPQPSGVGFEFLFAGLPGYRRVLCRVEWCSVEDLHADRCRSARDQEAASDISVPEMGRD